MTQPKETATRKPLPRFEEAEGLGPSDAAFVRDLVEVFEKHGNLDRFGLCLLHDHFPLGPDEVMVETNDPATRTLHAHVEKKDRTRHVKPSQWRFAPHGAEPDGGGPYQVVMLCDPLDLCPGDGGGRR
ncbi:hypothetical protein ACFY7H_01785 [Streptomyces sp. NPDC012794]|uniref:hypothetical protein n=1 Tax=Streptomyces sp. NPDC012794 TaxID=3364850 RepID=UPI00367F110F